MDRLGTGAEYTRERMASADVYKVTKHVKKLQDLGKCAAHIERVPHRFTQKYYKAPMFICPAHSM